MAVARARARAVAVVVVLAVALGRARVRVTPPPGAHLGLFWQEKKFDQEKSYETFYRENVPEKPLRTHHDKLSSIIPIVFEHRDNGCLP